MDQTEFSEQVSADLAAELLAARNAEQRRQDAQRRCEDCGDVDGDYRVDAEAHLCDDCYLEVPLQLVRAEIEIVNEEMLAAQPGRARRAWMDKLIQLHVREIRLANPDCGIESGSTAYRQRDGSRVPA